jgi:hypothetical protein
MAYDTLPHFHRRIGFPVTPPTIRIHVPDSMVPHAKNEAKNDRYGKISPPKNFTATPQNIFEIAYDPSDGQVKKVVARDEYDDDHDITCVIIDGSKVITVWLNKKSDTHSTLNTGRYEQPDDYR